MTVNQPRLLCISQSFAPDTTPTAIRAAKLVQRLGAHWDITVLTESEGQHDAEPARVKAVRSMRPSRLFAALRRLRLAKLLELAVWPDESVFWVLPAILTGWRSIKAGRPDAIVVFMMPYSSGLVGIALSRLTGLPLILNLDDSPTCTDMHPYFPTRLHYRLAVALEHYYARVADAIVYVSETNLIAASSGHPEQVRQRFHLVRYGADAPLIHGEPSSSSHFHIAYVGAMSGWWALIGPHAPNGRFQRLYDAWTRLGRYEITSLDQRTASPAILGQAILDAISKQPSWAGRVDLTVHGNPYPASVVARALSSAGVESVVTVFGPVAHDKGADIMARADLLFLTLPGRPDGSRGGRISAKTYEYLATDRPILAALPRGENWDYLADKPGVWLVGADDTERMRDVIVELAAAKFAGSPRTFDRARMHPQLSYDTRAAEFAVVIRAAIAHRDARRSA
jgi:hypothetical protein